MLHMHARTRRQREVLDFIVDHVATNGYRPSYRTIADHLGLNSRAGIGRIVRVLESQGLLARNGDNGRPNTDLNNGQSYTYGPANSLIEWLELPGSEIGSELPIALPQIALSGYEPDVVRAFRVPDDGMAEAHICEDDIALIEVRDFARDGQCVVAVLDGKRVVLRKYSRASADIELTCPEESGEVIRLAADRVEIKGVFRGLVRPMN
jgi:repressor LexA